MLHADALDVGLKPLRALLANSVYEAAADTAGGT